MSARPSTTKTGGKPIRSIVRPASQTPAAWPTNSALAKVETASPRASGAIWVAWVCSVACSMYMPSPSAAIAGAIDGERAPGDREIAKRQHRAAAERQAALAEPAISRRTVSA